MFFLGSRKGKKLQFQLMQNNVAVFFINLLETIQVFRTKIYKIFCIDLFLPIPQTEEFCMEKFSLNFEKFAKSRNLIHAKIYPLNKVEKFIEF